MDNIKKKHLIKKKKKIISLFNDISSMDETSIKFFGQQTDNFMNSIKISLFESLAKKKTLPEWLTKLSGLSGRKYRVLINNLVKRMKNPKYLEIGSFTGSTACSASFKNNLKITCIDNWSQRFDQNINPEKEFNNNIKKCITPNSNFKVINSDFRKVDFKKIGKFNIFLFDGPHHLEDHIDGISMVQDALENKFILIIDDWNWVQVRDGTFLALDNLKLKIISQLEIRTTHDGSNSLCDGENSDWHQGYSFFVIEKK